MKTQLKQFAIQVYSKNGEGEYTGEFMVDTVIAKNREEAMKPYLEQDMRAKIFKERDYVEPKQKEILPKIPIPEDVEMSSLDTPPISRHFTPSTQSIVEFEDNGIKFKIENGNVSKLDWVILEKDSYKIEDAVGEPLLNDTIIVKTKQWIKVK